MSHSQLFKKLRCDTTVTSAAVKARRAAVLIDGPARFAYHARVNNRRSQVVSQGRYSNGDRRGVVRAAWATRSKDKKKRNGRRRFLFSAPPRDRGGLRMAAAFNRASWIDEYRSVDFIRVLGEGRKEKKKSGASSSSKGWRIGNATPKSRRQDN